jgi:hypothetical protein
MDMSKKAVFMLVVALLMAGACSSALFAVTLTLDYSTYLGGSAADYGQGISVGTDEKVYLTGNTSSTDFPTENPYQVGSSGAGDAFVSALSSTGSVLLYSTYLGGSGYDDGLGISAGSDGTAYVVGHTYSSNFPMVNAYQSGYQVMEKN